MLAPVKNFNLEKDLIFKYILLFSNISFKKFIIIFQEPKTLQPQYSDENCEALHKKWDAISKDMENGNEVALDVESFFKK